MNQFTWSYPEANNFAQLSTYTEFQRSKEGRFEHQRIIARLLSDLTKYRDLLLFHGLGSGKTCSSTKTAELLREVGAVKRCVILTKGKALQKQIRADIVERCSAEKYQIDEDIDEVAKTRKYARLTKGFYIMYTYGEFSKLVRAMSDDEVVDKFNNHVFIIDEVQNIRTELINESYDSIQRVGRLLPNRYMMILSATPMRDTWSEIVSLYGLFGSDVEKVKPGTQLDDAWLKRLAKMWSGKVSTVLSVPTATIVTEGKVVPPLKTLVVYPTNMLEKQSRVYVNTLPSPSTDRTELNQTVYIQSRQASLCIDPNGNYGNTLSKELLLSYIGQASSQSDKINRIRQHSSMYADIIKSTIKAIGEGRKTFIFNSFVKGSGSELLLELFEAVGVPEWTPQNPSVKGGIALITSQLSSAEKTFQTIERFNKPDNTYGESIAVLIGSSIISEGISLLAVQRIHVCTPSWNMAQTDQAIGRGVRVGSHDMLPQEDRVVKVFLHANLPKPTELLPRGNGSIDLFMYSIAESKDKEIKSVERMLAENSIDCIMNNDFNNAILSSRNNGTRSCFYGDCAISCKQTPDSNKPYPNVYETHYVDDLKISLTIQDTLKNSKGGENIDSLYLLVKEKFNDSITKNAFYQGLELAINNNVSYSKSRDRLVVVKDDNLVYMSKSPVLKSPDLSVFSRFISEASYASSYPEPEPEMLVEDETIGDIDNMNSDEILYRLKTYFSKDENNELTERYKNNLVVFEDEKYILFDKFYKLSENSWTTIPFPSTNNTKILNSVFDDSINIYGIRNGSGSFKILDKRSDNVGRECSTISKKNKINDILLPYNLNVPKYINKSKRLSLSNNENEMSEDQLRAIVQSKYSNNVDTERINSYTKDELKKIIGFSRNNSTILCNVIETFLRNRIIQTP